MDNLILFGAGASFGSDDPIRTPPMGGNLFDALCRFNPGGWGAVPDDFAIQFRAEFERGMRAFADARPTDVDVLQRAMAAYFFQFHPGCSSLYIRLAQRIRPCNWNGALTSLNYERLLELAVREAGLNVVVRQAPGSGGGVELCLPHGCCHLFCQIRTKSVTQASGTPEVTVAAQRPAIIKPEKRADGTEVAITLRLARGGPIAFAPEVQVDSEEIHSIEDPDQHAKELRESTIPPVMCYFKPDKDTRAGVSLIKRQRTRFAELVWDASTVGIIGVKVRPHDGHIWDPLRGTSARIIYCAGNKAGEEFRCWSGAAGRHSDEVLPSYWAEAFDDLCWRVGLA